MNGVWRAVLGAALGALITLLIHPASRPLLMAPLRPIPPTRLEQTLPAYGGVLPPPTDVLSASVWMHVAAAKSRSRSELTEKECRTLVEIAKEAARHDPNNAFWLQMQAVFLARLGRYADARDAWLRASHKGVWNDYQTRELMEARHSIERQVGASQAWQYGYVYSMRSVEAATAIEKYARIVLAKADLDSPEGVDTRLATIRNGNLLRNGARSIREGMFGADIVDLAAYPPQATSQISPKRLYLGRNHVINSLKALDRQEEAQEVHQLFRENDSWSALPDRYDPEDEARSLMLASVTVATVPGALLILSGFGFVVWLAGRLLDRSAGARLKLTPAPALMCATAVGAFVLLATWYPVAAFATALSSLCLTIGPNRARSQPNHDLGPLFTFTVLMVALLFGVSLGLYFVGHTTAAEAVLPFTGTAGEFCTGSTSLVGVAAIVLGVLFLVAPMWAVVHRMGTPFVLSLAVRRFGAILSVGALALAILATPLAIYADRQIGGSLGKIAGNEPVYYLDQP